MDSLAIKPVQYSGQFDKDYITITPTQEDPQNKVVVKTLHQSNSSSTLRNPPSLRSIVYKAEFNSKSNLSLGSNQNQSELDSQHHATSSSSDSTSTVVENIEVVVKLEEVTSNIKSDKAVVEKKSPLDSFKSHWLDFLTWFTPYRQIFLVVVTVNASIVISIISGALGGPKRDLSLAVILNIFVAIAIRNEWVIRLIYWIFIKSFRSPKVPIKIRKHIVGILYHIGGLHSGCGLSALFWLGLSAYRHLKNPNHFHPVVITLLSISIGCILITCITATPIFRGKRHDLFEMIHRFIGWLGIISTLVFVILGHLLSRTNPIKNMMDVILDVQFWLMITILFFIISSWITTRHVDVECFASSKKATVVKVPGGLTSGLHTRISRGGLKEWHIFGSISEGKHSNCHYIVAAVQGEFTGGLNLDQPTRLYTKLWKPAGLPYFSRMFNRGVAICTGSGIGAVASTCIQHSDWFLIWIGPDLQNTYGSEIMNLIEDKIPTDRRLIWDTRGPLGRPDVFSLLSKTYKDWNAEVVLFIGSPALNKSVLRSSREHKIPLFGSIWDA
ncbi:uncharacterized protein MELLADRAFT_110786 [Melampsora larici-populina 98AG31]|uniref:Non-ribosomal peptide synthetase n=1 Tax=Melampsora larici-populina (strain 98AG31 / pathotype 3-4-7) TaxID=747676 RepID=F4S0Y9_MELLP|nr:uncharacterized protein MELLADRAFT_110786 [Melampsora larici-populina 98AG31]EGG01674.1 hypothetical protein MELLADRAFT_110786 [Melampsora larici-populina 98AG31]